MGHVPATGARLAFWDTQGPGAPVVFLHPATGSAHMWLYQQPVFAAAGHRVIGWSRRGHRGSDPVDPGAPGSASDDLLQVLDHLGVARCHLVAAAAGGAIAIDFALSHADRLYSMVIASSVGGVQDADYLAASQSLRPAGFDALPSEFREIGPSYRAANPTGVAAWRELEHGAVTGARLGQKVRNHITFAALESLRVPVLLMSGDADLWMPPALTRRYAAHLPAAELLVVPEVGHAIYWEAPATFNAEVLAFIGRHLR
jgi:pimeloyl-ACP methyl ester carboxylesterase